MLNFVFHFIFSLYIELCMYVLFHENVNIDFVPQFAHLYLAKLDD